jgi:hypothetical protein
LIKEISRKEDPSFKLATVAAVGWAMPTIREAIFQKSPHEPNAAWSVWRYVYLVGFTS